MIELEYEPLHDYRVTFKWFDGSYFKISMVCHQPATNSDSAITKAMFWMRTYYDGEMPVNYTVKVQQLKEIEQ